MAQATELTAYTDMPHTLPRGLCGMLVLLSCPTATPRSRAWTRDGRTETARGEEPELGQNILTQLGSSPRGLTGSSESWSRNSLTHVNLGASQCFPTPPCGCDGDVVARIPPPTAGVGALPAGPRQPMHPHSLHPGWKFCQLLNGRGQWCLPPERAVRTRGRICTGLTADVIGRYQACLPREGPGAGTPPAPPPKRGACPPDPARAPRCSPSWELPCPGRATQPGLTPLGAALIEGGPHRLERVGPLAATQESLEDHAASECPIGPASVESMASPVSPGPPLPVSFLPSHLLLRVPRTLPNKRPAHGLGTRPPGVNPNSDSENTCSVGISLESSHRHKS